VTSYLEYHKSGDCWWPCWYCATEDERELFNADEEGDVD
jgi:hypothetical protein